MIAMLQNRSASGAWEGTTTQEEEEEPVRHVMTGIVEVMRFPPVGTPLNSAPLRNCGCSNSVDPGAGN